MSSQTAAEKRPVPEPRNGVDTPTLFATINAVAGQPELAKFRFRATNRWQSGTHSRTRIESFSGAGGDHTHTTDFVFDADHPQVLVGADKGPLPIEFLLVGLATCLTSGIANISAARRVTLTEVESKIEGDIDLRGILGLSDEVRNGYCDCPAVPEMAARIPDSIHQLAPTRYRNPNQLREGGVLIVGAAVSGIQLADEIAESGRRVLLAVGRHTRMVRQYRGRDILWWLDRMGILDETTDQVHDVEISKQQPALQLVGRPDRASIDLGRLAAKGVRILGRAAGVDGHQMFFDDDLIATTTAADVKLAGLLSRIDQFVDRCGMNSEVGESEPFEPVWPRFFSSPAAARCDLRAEAVGTIIWATGFRRSYPWLHLPVFDERGEIRQTRGVTPEPGLYVLGLQFQNRRRSAFIDGVGADAEELATQLARREAESRSDVA